MKRIITALCLALLCFSPVFAQSSGSEEPSFDNQFFMTQKGDQYLRIGLSGVFPLNFPSVDKLFTQERKLSAGGAGYIGYHYFLTNKFAIGADAGFGFNATIGKHMFHYIPVTVTATYQPSIGNFEFPLTLGIGGAWEAYNGYTYFPGLVIKPQVGVHYRPLQSWSFGGELSYMFLPQFAHLYDKEAKNYLGQFAELAIVARYYF